MRNTQLKASRDYYFVPTADFQSRAVSSSTPAHVLNIEIKDNHEDATLGAFLIYELCQMVWVFVFTQIINELPQSV